MQRRVSGMSLIFNYTGWKSALPSFPVRSGQDYEGRYII